MISQQRFRDIVEKFSSIDPVLVLGDVGVDKYTYGEVTRISPEAPVPVLEVTKEWMKLGLAANVSDNLKSLLVDSTLCGVIGSDVRASQFESMLEERKLKTWGIVRDETRCTTYKERLTTISQQICRVDYEDSSPLSDSVETVLVDRIHEFAQNHSALIIEDYAKGLVSESIIQKVVSIYKDAGKVVAVDPSRTTPPTWYKGVNLLKPNFSESKMMTQALGYKTSNVEEMSQILIDKLSLEKIVITLGADGMGYVDTKGDGKLHIIPTVAKEVFDVSGAGDTAISAIVSSLVAGATLEEASWIGNCASGVVVGKKGTALVNKEELFDYYKGLSASVK